jgi:hypothetical protein
VAIFAGDFRKTWNKMVRKPYGPPRQKCPDRFRFGHFLFGRRIKIELVSCYLYISFNTIFNSLLVRQAAERGTCLGYNVCFRPLNPV